MRVPGAGGDLCRNVLAQLAVAGDTTRFRGNSRTVNDNQDYCVIVRLRTSGQMKVPVSGRGYMHFEAFSHTCDIQAPGIAAATLNKVPLVGSELHAR